MIDNDFAKALDTMIPEGVTILCINDCCHSGSICDIDTYRFTHSIYQISAAQDLEEAVDTGRGGVLTTWLRRAVHELSLIYGHEEFSMDTVMQRTDSWMKRWTDQHSVSL